MLIDNPREHLRFAHQGRFAMPAFNVCNLEMARAVLEAAVLEAAPVIVQTYPGDLAHGDFEALTSAIKSLAGRVEVPVFLHLDHGPDFAFAARCLKAGYNSVMFDGHHLPLKQALARTNEVAQMAHALNAAVEGELGSFGAGQGDQVILTNPADVRAMFAEGDVDMLAVSVGSSHGQPSRLDLGLLEQIATQANRPLVLHGGSGIFEEDLRHAIRLGVVKVNIGSALSKAWLEGSRQGLEASESHYGLLKRATDQVRAVAQHRLRLMGASGRAWDLK